MSGVECVGLGLAILPILIEAVKNYDLVAEKFRTFRHYSRDVGNVNLEFRTQKALFENECKLLLSLSVSDGSDRKAMVHDHAHRLWNDAAVDAKLMKVLGSDLELCKVIMLRSDSVLQQLANELKCFDCLVERNERKTETTTMRDTIRKFRRVLKITFEKSQYEKMIGALRERTADLRLLRSQMLEMSLSKPSASLSQKAIPACYGSVRKASQTLQEALQKARWCGSHSQGSHTTKLRVEAEIKDNVILDIEIACQTSLHSNADSGLRSESPLWLYVQNESIEQWPEPTQITGDAALRSGQPIANNTRKPSDTTPLERRAAGEEHPKKRRKVQFVVGAVSVVHSRQCEPIIQIEYADLRLASDIYRILRRDCHVPTECLGYLESPNLFRHKFYLGEHDLTRRRFCKSTCKVVSVPELIMGQAEESASVVDQLQLAKKATTAVLQYHLTPWLTSEWSLSQLSLFGVGENLMCDNLETLHVTTVITPDEQTPCPLRKSTEIQMKKPDERCEAGLLYGVDNVMLFSLGVALLQIGFWKPIEKLRRDGDPNDVITARRLMARQTPLGPRYQRLVQKCLRCDFGSGIDLSSAPLQNAVYRNVMCELDSMIDALRIADE